MKRDKLIKKTSEQFRKLLLDFCAHVLSREYFISGVSGAVFKRLAPRIIVLLLTHFRLKVNLPALVLKKKGKHGCLYFFFPPMQMLSREKRKTQKGERQI